MGASGSTTSKKPHNTIGAANAHQKANDAWEKVVLAGGGNPLGSIGTINEYNFTKVPARLAARWYSEMTPFERALTL